MLAVRHRIGSIMTPDVHSDNGIYRIRSLYFDDFMDTALREKLDGAARREKFRIRFYNGDTSYISLECKEKLNGLCRKTSCIITADETEKILHGDIDWLPDRGSTAARFYTKVKNSLIFPKTIVDYTREAYTFAPGNVRVTLDYNIRTGTNTSDLLSPDCVTYPAALSPIILEVKWDEFLPDVIFRTVQLPGRSCGAFSKYAACRIYG